MHLHVIDMGTIDSWLQTASIMELPYHTESKEFIVKCICTDRNHYTMGENFSVTDHLLELRLKGDITLSRFNANGSYFNLGGRLIVRFFSENGDKLFTKVMASMLKTLRRLGVDCEIRNDWWIYSNDVIKAGLSNPEAGGRKSVYTYLRDPMDNYWETLLPIYMEKMGYSDYENYELNEADYAKWSELQVLHASEDWIISGKR